MKRQHSSACEPATLAPSSTGLRDKRGARRSVQRTSSCEVVLLFVVLATTSGCAHHPENSPLATYDPESGYRSHNLVREGSSDSLAVVLTFSGGGTRASAFAYGVLEEMAATEIHWDGRHRWLIDEIDWISAVSGGSFTAAYYALYGNQIFSDFEERFLKRNVQRALMSRLFNPVNWIRLMSPYFGTSDLAAEFYDKHLFDGATFADLLAAGGPEIAINATDVVLRSRFAFNQQQFDWICSDVLEFPVARAIAASSAVPIVLSPVTLTNYAGTCAYRPPDHLVAARKTRDWSSRMYHQAQSMASYLDRHKRSYLHLMDGGLSDNLGLRAALEDVLFAGGAAQALEVYGLTDLRKLLVIVVNAQAAPDDSWDRRRRVPSIFSQITAASKVSLDRYSFETVQLLRENLTKWEQAVRQARCKDITGPRGSAVAGADTRPACNGLDIYLVEVSFDATSFAQEREYLKRVATSFNLSDEEVDRVRAAARAILRQSPEFHGILHDIEQESSTTWSGE